VDLVPTTATTRNVLAVLPGSGALAKEVVVLGAHLDHLGHGGAGSMRPDSAEVHNGADDNASGVAGVVCAAKALRAAAPGKNARTVVVAAFSAEEIGIGGSAWYVQHPLFPLADTVAMVNLDMVGRVREGRLSLLGTDSSPMWAGVLETAGKAAPALTLATGGDGYGPSDHASFYGADIPVAHLFSGAHEQYHTPDDDGARLNLDGGADVVRLTTAIVGELRTTARPTFARSTTSAPSMGDSRGYGAWFGSVPDYTAMEATSGGVKISGTRAGSPAERAGLQKGDVIVGMAGVAVQNLYDMTYVLRENKPGESIEVVVKRDGKEVRLLATLAARPTGSDAPHPPQPPPHASFQVESDPALPGKKGEWRPGAGKLVPDLMRPDEPHLADLRRLTFGGENAEAYWGPDGHTLSFQRTQPAGGCDAQYLYDLDAGTVTLASSGQGRTTCGYLDYPKGGSMIYATTEAAGPSCPPAPDYSKGYVWPVYDSYEIVRDDLKGGRTPIITSPGYDAEATECFRDGRIVFTSTRNGDLDLYVANADGSGVKQLTDLPGYDGGAFFTPDCKRLVFRASRPEGTALDEYRSLLATGLVRPTQMEIYVMNADGSGVQQLTRHGVGSFAPYPTPDGKGVLYSSNRGDNPREFDIWFVDWKGNEERITTAPGFDGFPMFSPDGRWLVFASNRATEAGKRDTDLYIARWVR
jgi:Tol biopolymer transport system component